MREDSRISEQRVVVTSFLVDILDVVVNLFIAYITGSVVMLSELFQGLADLTTTGFLLIGHKRSKKRPDRIHPFGHGKEIFFWALISAVVMMTLTATGSFIFGFERFFNPHTVSHIWYGFVALGISVCTNGYACSLSIRRLLKKKPVTQLPSIFLNDTDVASKNALVLDAMGTSAAVFGLISLVLYEVTGETRFDAVGAMIIGIVTAVLAFILITGVRGFLVGKRASPEIENKIKKSALSIPEVREVLDLRTMQIGSDKLLVNMEVHMKNNLTTDELEELTDKIKLHVQRTVPSVQHIQVELESPRGQ